MYTNTSILPPFLCMANTRITPFRTVKEEASLIVKTLDSSKAHDWVNITLHQ